MLLSEITAPQHSSEESGWVTPTGEVHVYTDHYTGAVDLINNVESILKKADEIYKETEDDSDRWETVYRAAYDQGFVAFVIEGNKLWVRGYDRLNASQQKGIWRLAKEKNLQIRDDIKDESVPQYTSHRYM